MSDTTILESIESYLSFLATRRSKSTVRNYGGALQGFAACLSEHALPPSSTDVSELTEAKIAEVFIARKPRYPSTDNHLFYAIIGWCRYLSDQGLQALSIPKLKQRIKPYLLRQVKQSTSQPDHYDISRLVDYAFKLSDQDFSDNQEHLRLLRDRALIVLLADTGMDALAVSNLRRTDRKAKQLIVRGEKGGSVVVRLAPRAHKALCDYLEAREPLDKAAGHSLGSLPIFAGHRSNQLCEVQPITTKTVTTIIRKRASEALGMDYDACLFTVKSFRHYHVDSLLQSLPLLHPRVLEKSEEHFKNHNYDDAIFNAMKLIEEEIRLRTNAESTDVGANLVTQAMQARSPQLPEIVFSQVPAEQEAAYFLYRGAIGSFKNPHSHRFVGVSDPVEAFECLALASLLMRMLDRASFRSTLHATRAKASEVNPESG